MDVAQGTVSAIVPMYLFKCYETLNFAMLRMGCERYASKTTLACLASAMRRAARFFGLGGLVAGPSFAEFEIKAGCSFDTTLVRVFIIGPLDGLMLPRSVTLDVAIDDYGVRSPATVGHVVDDLTSAVASLEAAIVHGRGCTVSKESANLAT